jgi:nitrogen fixation protein NifU and related proteins
MTLRLEQMYQDVILDHYKHPQHRGLREPFGAQVSHKNPVCGDDVTLRVALSDDGETVVDVSYDGQGCSISQASTSVMSGLVVGEPIGGALELSDRFLELMQPHGDEKLTDEVAESLDDAIAFAGVSKYPARVKCALLGWMAMKGALAEASATDDANNAGESR